MGGKGAVSTDEAQHAQAGLANQLTTLLNQQGGESQQLFNLAFPGMEQSTQFFQSLASGSPSAIASAIAPAAQQVTQATTGAKQNIMQSAPAGGERNLALEQADVARGAQIGSLASQGFTGAFNALASIGGHGVQLGQGAASTAIGAGQAAGQQWQNIIQQNNASKGASLGAIGQGAGSAADIAMMLAFA